MEEEGGGEGIGDRDLGSGVCCLGKDQLADFGKNIHLS